MALTEYDAEANTSDGEASFGELDKQLKSWFRYDMSHVSKWRSEAKEDFEFYAGDQWSAEDLAYLREHKRPTMSHNMIGRLVNAIVGSEINNRREVRYVPREAGDALPNELLSSAGEWFRDETNAEDEESDAFEDTVICGMGWTDTRLDFETDPDGAPKIERIDPLEMVWDCNAVKPNLEDAQRVFRVREMSWQAAQDMFPDENKVDLNAAWVRSTGGDKKEPHDQDDADRYTSTQDDYANAGFMQKKCLIVEARWFEKETYYRGPDLMNPQAVKEYDERQVKLLEKQYPGFPSVKQTRKKVVRAFIGRKVLGKPDKPMVPAGLLGWECITGYRDKVNAQFYGIVRAAKDPQRWSNKWLSQTVHILNTLAKGGIMAERDAFDDVREAEESWARSDAITYMKPGSLSGQNPKIAPKPTGQFPAGFFTLYQNSQEAVTQVTGLSPEFLGTREVDQAGVLEYQRRQSSLNLLASLFNSLRRYRKRQGKTLLFLIQEHLADGRLIRIIGEDKRQYVPLTKDAVANRQYDIIVDDSPTSPNEKDRTWQIIMQMMPMLKGLITPEIAVELLSLSPLDASLVEKLKKKAAQAAAAPKPPSPEEQKIAGEREKHQMEMAGLQADLQADQVKSQMSVQESAIDLMMKEREMEMDAARDEQKFVMDMRRAAIQERQNAIAAQRANSDRTRSAN